MGIADDPHTAHTFNPVPFVSLTPAGGDGGRVVRDGGSLPDVAPTLLSLLGIEPPPEMTGSSASVTGLLVSVSVADAVASVWFSSAVVTQATPSGQAHPDERSSAFPSTSPTPFLPAGTTATATVSVRSLIGRF
jgi:hypothetical protein